MLFVEVQYISLYHNYIKGSEWSIVSAIDHYINISKYNYLAGSSYTKLPKELDHPKKLVFKTLMIINASKCV